MKNIFDQSKQFNFLTCNITCITISFCEQRVHFIKFKYQKEDEVSIYKLSWMEIYRG